MHAAGAVLFVQLLYHSFVFVALLDREHDADLLRLRHARRRRPRRTCAVVPLHGVLRRVVRLVVARVGAG